jgi:homoprotocatechuate degradation regulator HpaR
MNAEAPDLTSLTSPEPTAPPSVLTRRNLPLLMLQAREAVFARFRPLLNEAGVTEQQWRIVRALLENGPMEPRQIAQMCCLSSPSLAGILSRMDDLGWVQRERLANDQRRVLVSATEAAQALATRLAPQVSQHYEALETQLGPALLARTYELLDELLQALPESDTTDGI